ncbi:MAG TPA: radical SAM/SPASM domain-containing protein, partial [Saprospiraceae bacterium]|nr:radical SAM/SPASM domain-containing protein [Saprospiraceae bacterium]
MLHWADTRRFFSKLTFPKVSNMLSVWTSYQLTKWLKRPIQWGTPMTISVEPTTACNLRCPECPSGLRAFTRETGNMKEDFFRSLIDGLHRKLTWLIFYFQGERFINPKFLDMVSYAHQNGIYTITSTNGHFLHPENARRTVASGLDRILISIDGSTQEVYEQYRKEGNLDTVLQGARNLVQAKRQLHSSTPHIVFQMLVVRPNEHQIEEVKRLAKEIGVDEVKLKTAQVYDFEHGNELIPTLDQYSRYKETSPGRWQLKNKLLNHCWKLWHACVITWDGLVVPCCFDKDANHQLGDLKKNSFKEIWKGITYHQFRQQLLGGRDQI